MNYREYLNKREKEFSKIDIFFIMAFTEKRLEQKFKEEAVKKGYADVDSFLKDIYSLGDGAYIMKSEYPKLKAHYDNDELSKLMRDAEFAEDAFLYEMNNHEYGINCQANYDVLSCFGTIEWVESDNPKEYFEQLGFEKENRNAFMRARKRYFKSHKNG